MLDLSPGLDPEPGRGHHIAFDVPANRFDAGAAWLQERATVLTKQGRSRFVPVGDQHGLLILTDVRRVLMPTTSTTVLAAPVTVYARGPRDATVHPTRHSTLVLTAGGAPYRGPGQVNTAHDP